MQNNQTLSLHRKRKIKHLSFFFLRFSIIGINLLIRGSINEKDKKPLIDRFHHL